MGCRLMAPIWQDVAGLAGPSHNIQSLEGQFPGGRAGACNLFTKASNPERGSADQRMFGCSVGQLVSMYVRVFTTIDHSVSHTHGKVAFEHSLLSDY